METQASDRQRKRGAGNVDERDAGKMQWEGSSRASDRPVEGDPGASTYGARARCDGKVLVQHLHTAAALVCVGVMRPWWASDGSADKCLHRVRNLISN